MSDTVKLMYFAWVREKVGMSSEVATLPKTAKTVGDVMAWLKTRGPEFKAAFENDTVIRAAIDQTHAQHDASITDAREIAFFPPVTGG
ncbi:MAG: molybdopterin converting factor subunit 1 [Pseudomonadota bacterium]